MKASLRVVFAAVLIFLVSKAAFPQLGMFSNEQRLDLTREWKGDRFPDGRPEVPEALGTRGQAGGGSLGQIH